jgi:hypothetical protein
METLARACFRGDRRRPAPRHRHDRTGRDAVVRAGAELAPAFRGRAALLDLSEQPVENIAMLVRATSAIIVPSAGEIRAAEPAPYPDIRALHHNRAGRTEARPDEGLPARPNLLVFLTGLLLRLVPPPPQPFTTPIE